jgi:amidohydrolase
MAILLTVAEVLSARREELPGRVTFVFQPAEERVGGASGMIADGALDSRPDACFGLHLWNELPLGIVDARPGPIFASADAFAIRLASAGGHAAMPHQVPDPVVASAQLILALQTLVSRETPPLEPAVLTIGSVHGGSAPNIIPAQVELQGTLRAFEPAVRERLLRRIDELAHSVPALSGVASEIQATDCCPACINHPEMTELVQRVAARFVGAECVSSTTRTMGADDMSLFLDAVPGCYFFVGGSNAERGLASPHHSPAFDFDEAALEVGVNVLTGVALEYLHG